MGETFKQDLKDKNDFPGAPFIVRMLFREKPELPEAGKMTEIMEKHCGPVEMFSCDGNMAGFAASGCMAKFKDGEVPPQLWILGASEFSADGVDDFTKSQMWDCMDERDEILGGCRWQMHASDMLALLPALERANLDMDFTDALAELFPDCEAFLFQNTGKLVRARDVRAHGLSGADRYMRFGLHARFFNVEGTDDMVVDTLGMGTLFMPDLQYHFHSLDPNWLVHHACSTALYIIENDCPIKSGEIIDGVEAETGRISRSVPWRCRYEQALIQPAREVLDIEAGEFASGPRES